MCDFYRSEKEVVHDFIATVSDELNVPTTFQPQVKASNRPAVVPAPSARVPTPPKEPKRVRVHTPGRRPTPPMASRRTKSAESAREGERPDTAEERAQTANSERPSTTGSVGEVENGGDRSPVRFRAID